MEEIVLEPKDAVDWSYRGEGAINLVLAYTGSSPTFLGKVMRIKKKLKKGYENGGDTSGNGLTSLENIIWGGIKDLVSCQNKEMVDYLFVKHVMRPLLGHKHVNAGIRRLVATEFLESIEKMVRSQHISRRDNASSVDTNLTSVLLMDDLTSFAQGHVEDHVPCLTVEIKPKCGFLPSSSFISEENLIKKTIPLFEMYQVRKLRENEILEISKYDPLDLFSGSKDRIHKAIKALYATPQTNFRVFLNGSLVFGGFRGSKCIATSKDELAFEHILKGIIKTEDDSVRANSFIELVAETIYASGALDQLLEVQKLDRYNIEAVIHAYYDLIDHPCKACQELEKSKLSNQFGAMHAMPQDEKVNILKNFLISSTATDCSVMVSIRSRGTGLSSHGNVHLESTKQDFEYKVHFIDLDMRPLNRMESYYESDKKIMKTYLEMLKTKGDQP
ncbi:PREDICTED: inositol-pentakisphosphate 2-kinase-like [Camelina sativa]|uniref:Inositol-pentakisphosphate 2-kinase n=1 Tax=Camelina sativa TaxID=90675 RepID=A0ABM0Z6D4_CAMSA|nr:PREDICTED: inositol-pentakisphosphate 2-kinase-like [Camelina sativa]XP_010511061.1 PREDICTED: inositol-pentakisphosphate 2-kinase-like [Camelina sativa]XP_010511062.1 PREDICTED: inositol-pentakisphosphate 2-kinase-like [Camelina sativa]XP_010511063.1 PREDICTED: inositol-pentakisphosphate 2-kinase-like [Camelina sativa]